MQTKQRNSWWCKKWGKEILCPIAQTKLRPGKNKYNVPYTTTLKCGHRFNTNALLTWLDNNNTCPMCRKIITKFNYN